MKLEEDLGIINLESKKIAASILTASFTALRAEIMSRSGFQNAIIPATIAASGAVISLYFNMNFSNNKSEYAYAVLFSIPFFLPIIGLIWLEHHLAISTIGSFLRCRLMPQLFSTAKPSEEALKASPETRTQWSFVEWERFCAAIVKSQKRNKIDIIPYRFIFGFFPAATWLFLFATGWHRNQLCAVTWPSYLIIILLASSAIIVVYFFVADVRVTRRIIKTRCLAENAEIDDLVS